MIEKNYKHLCILYPGGGGGNHLSNLISTIPNFEKIVLSGKNYINHLLRRYEREKFVSDNSSFRWFNVHLGKNHLLDLRVNTEEVRNQLNTNTDKNIIFGHWANYQINILNNTFVDYDDCVWIILTYPEKNTLPWMRIEKHQMYPQQPEKYNLPLDIEMDTSDSNSFMLLANENNGFAINIEEFFSHQGWDYVNNKLTENLGFSLPVESKPLHDFWINEVTSDVS